MKLIVGLGNPGAGYTRNRHNIGFMCLNRFARKHGIRFTRKQGQARIGEGEINSMKLILARPQTMMNLSGQSVSRLVKRYNIVPEDLIIIHDDLDLPLGKVRIRQGGRPGGHKGIESTIACLGTGNFIRVRVGIGRPVLMDSTDMDRDSGVINHVLGDFDASENKIVAEVMNKVNEAILCLINEGLTATMNRYN
ncbi:MAG TPA: aminoacyl-tRNA hydrolase [Dehalococcoidales bacterium]|nr:aminoacyl-tRNA hydrolase [Dehalococcoidales bacterium]